MVYEMYNKRIANFSRGNLFFLRLADPCSSLDCLNNGSCNVTLNGTAECDCAPGYIGMTCDIGTVLKHVLRVKGIL